MSAGAHVNMDSTIRRLRRKRRAIVQRKRRQRLLAAGGAFSFALATAIGVAGFAGTNLTDVAAARAASFMDMMDRRSPGTRTEAQLNKTVHRVLPERESATPPAVPANLAEVIAPPAPAIVPVDIAPPAQLAWFQSTPPGAVLVAPPGGGGGPKVPPGGGGGCCGGGDTPPGQTVPENPPPPPPVPEPGTWMTMLLGFGMMGWLLRRNGSRSAARARA